MSSKPNFCWMRTLLLGAAICTLAGPVMAQTFNFYEAGYRWNFENRHVYRMTPQAGSWDQTRQFARNHSIGGVHIPGDLVTIRSEQEALWLLDPDTNLLQRVPKPNHWIGFTDNGRFSQEGIWVWVSGEPGQFRENQEICTRYCNFLEDAIANKPTPDYAYMQDDRGNFPGKWFPDINTSAHQGGPWHGIVEFVPPFPGAFEDNNGDNIPDLWEDNNQNGVPDGYEDGPPIPSPRNLRAGGGRHTIRLVWEHALSPDLLGYNLQRLDDRGNFAVWETLNTNGLLLDPVFIDGFDNGVELPTTAMRTYRVEAVFNIDGKIRTSLSNEATGAEGDYVIALPAVQTPPGSETLVRYPIGVLNARGIVATGFEMQVILPSFVRLDAGVDVRRTALTESFPELEWDINSDTRAVTLSTTFTTQLDIPLNGEGALVELFFRIEGDAPVGTIGEVSIEYANFHIGPGVTSRVNLEDVGSIEVSPNFFPGDPNGDGELTFEDVAACASLALGVIPPTLKAYSASDLNGDGIVDVLDVTLLRTLLSEAGNIPKAKGTGAKGGGMGFELKMVDNEFPTVPSEVDMEVAINMPEGELDGIAGAGFTINYATEHVILKGIQLEGDSFDELFYDQRDYLRGWKPGRVKVIVSSEDNKVINGAVAKVKFESVANPMVPSTDVPVSNGKMAKSNGASVAWTSLVQLDEGVLLFPGSPGIDINIVVDDVIDAKDLLKFIELIKTGPQEGSILYEFSKEWLTPR